MAARKFVNSTSFGRITIERSASVAPGFADAFDIAGSGIHRGMNIEIAFVCSDEESFAQLLPFAEQFWNQRSVHFKTFREYAVSKLHEPLNESLDSGQKEPTQFTKKELNQTLKAPNGLTFWESESETDMLVCDLGFGNDLMEHEYIIVRLAQDGSVIEGEVRTLL